jgi:hypothetical protein
MPQSHLHDATQLLRRRGEFEILAERRMNLRRHHLVPIPGGNEHLANVRRGLVREPLTRLGFEVDADELTARLRTLISVGAPPRKASEMVWPATVGVTLAKDPGMTSLKRSVRTCAALAICSGVASSICKTRVAATFEGAQPASHAIDAMTAIEVTARGLLRMVGSFPLDFACCLFFRSCV